MRAKRAKNFGAFLGVLQGKTTKKRLFLRFQIGKKWTFGRPGFWKYQNPDSNIWPDFENMKTLFQKFGRKITKGGGFNIMGVVHKTEESYVKRRSGRSTSKLHKTTGTITIQLLILFIES